MSAKQQYDFCMGVRERICIVTTLGGRSGAKKQKTEQGKTRSGGERDKGTRINLGYAWMNYKGS